MRSLAIAAAAALLAAGPALALDAGDRTVAPGRVGAMVKATPPADLAKIYGAGNVQYKKVPAAEGQEQPGAVIHAGTPDELQVGFTEDSKRIEFIRIVGTRWQTKEGIRIGTSLAELERINGGPFQFSGFGWDYGGAVFTNPRGKLPKDLGITIAPTKNGSNKEAQQVMGDRKFSSRHPALKTLGVVVSSGGGLRKLARGRPAGSARQVIRRTRHPAPAGAGTGCFVGAHARRRLSPIAAATACAWAPKPPGPDSRLAIPRAAQKARASRGLWRHRRVEPLPRYVSLAVTAS